ncbi:MAG: ABC transporter permease [Sedimentisphaerales bacterium]|nr:ABC transporter permease [Sedimentisphaerales bacterium]
MISGIWAVAKNLIRETLRMRFLMAFVILFISVCTAGFAFWIWRQGIPTVEGISGSSLAAAYAGDRSTVPYQDMQTFLGYSIRLTTWFFSLLTIFLSIATIARDIKRREIFTITTKPIGRGQFLLGKFMGIALLNLLFLGVTFVSIYVTSRVLEQALLPADAESRQYERRRIEDLVLVARRGVQPPLPDFTDQATEMADRLVQERLNQGELTGPGEIERFRNSKFQESVQQLQMRSRAVGPQETMTFRFPGIEPVNRENGYVYIRFKQDVSLNPPDLVLWNEWWCASADPLAAGVASYHVAPQRQAIRTVHEFGVPVSIVSANNELFVMYRNNAINSAQGEVVVIFPPDGGIEALYVAGTYEGNMFRGMVLIYFRLIFLSILGIAAGAWLSMPVAVLLVSVIYVVGLASGFILEAVGFQGSVGYMTVMHIFLTFFPKLAAYDPVRALETGRIVELGLIGTSFVFLLLLQGGFVALVGYLIFRFRELARVIV